MVFDPSPDNFTASRAVATNNGVPGAILRAVVTNDTLLPNAFNSLDGFVETTSSIYVGLSRAFEWHDFNVDFSRLSTLL